MNYLTPAQVLFIHARLVAETGGATGVRDLGLLEAAIARPRATFQGHDLYPDLLHKTAALMEPLIGNHPFVDGNKRVGVTTAGLFLQINGRRLTAKNDELEQIALSTARGETNVEVLSAWLEQYSEPYHG